MSINQDLVQQARQADLAAYLMSRGENLKRVGSNYTLTEHDSLRIKGNMYYWNSRGTHGNSVDFLMEYYNMSFQNAVEALTSHASNIGGNLILPTSNAPQRAAQPPLRANDEKRAIAYLCKRRGLDSSIVFSLIKSGKLWQDTHGNCNFLICDWQEQPIGAEIVGTGDTRYKQTTAHSGYGFHLICGDEPDTAMYFESAIDLLSCYQLHKDKLTHHILVSMGGLNNSVIEELCKVRPQLTHWLCVDNDPAGDKFIIDIQHTMLVKVFRPPTGKDWNEYLID